MRNETLKILALGLLTLNVDVVVPGGITGGCAETQVFVETLVESLVKPGYDAYGVNPPLPVPNGSGVDVYTVSLGQPVSILAEIPPELLDLGDQGGGDRPVSTAPVYGADEFDDDGDIDDFDQTPQEEAVPTWKPEPQRESPIRAAAQRAAAAPTGSGFAAGMRVNHATFGEGKVLRTDGTGSKLKLTIDFPDVGRKVIVARFVEPA